MKKDICLIDQKCAPCNDKQPKMKLNEIQLHLKQLNNFWDLDQKEHLYKNFKFIDFNGSISFANRIAEVAEKLGHHPDLHISYSNLEVEIWTHKIDGLSENDFILAKYIDQVY